MIIILAAMDENRTIGTRGSGMPWGRTLKDDLKSFKEQTIGRTVIMGRKTFTDDIRSPLPNRRNIILSRNPDFKSGGCEVLSSLEEAVRRSCKREKLYVIGGAEVFALALPMAEEMRLTRIAHSFPEGNVYFPEFSLQDWSLVESEHYPKNNRNSYRFTIQLWRRK